MIATIAVIAETKKVQQLQQSYGNHFPVITATTITEIEKILSQRSLSLQSLESGFLMIAELFFLSDCSDRSNHMETRLKLHIFTK